MHNVISIADIYPLIREKLEAGGSVVLPASGNSMWPLFHHYRDYVVIVSTTSKKPRKNDLALYDCKNGQFKLHRIIGFEKNGDLILCGDNQIIKERHVHPQQIVGYVDEFTRNNRVYHCSSKKYKLYCFMLPVLRLFWSALFFVFQFNCMKKILHYFRQVIHCL